MIVLAILAVGCAFLAAAYFWPRGYRTEMDRRRDADFGYHDSEWRRR